MSFLDDFFGTTKKVAPPIPQKEKYRLRDVLYPKQSGKCTYCKRKLPKDLLHIEHKKPRKSGGTNAISNLHLACATCNNHKHAKSHGEYQRQIKKHGTAVQARTADMRKSRKR